MFFFVFVFVLVEGFLCPVCVCVRACVCVCVFYGILESCSQEKHRIPSSEAAYIAPKVHLLIKVSRCRWPRVHMPVGELKLHSLPEALLLH